MALLSLEGNTIWCEHCMNILEFLSKISTANEGRTCGLMWPKFGHRMNSFGVKKFPKLMHYENGFSDHSQSGQSKCLSVFLAFLEANNKHKFHNTEEKISKIPHNTNNHSRRRWFGCKEDLLDSNLGNIVKVEVFFCCMEIWQIKRLSGGTNWQGKRLDDWWWQ